MRFSWTGHEVPVVCAGQLAGQGFKRRPGFTSSRKRPPRGHRKPSSSR